MFELVCVTNRNLCREDFFKRLQRIAQSDVDKIILREKDLAEEEYLNLAEKAFKFCAGQEKKLILHNYLSAAKKLSQSKIHLPLSMLEKNPPLREEFEIIGTSVHSLEQLKNAEALGASYVTAGHIFKTNCKKDLAPRGISFLQSICNRSHIPVYAIGGINLETVSMLAEVKSPMFKGICIMSEFMTCENPKEYAQSLKISLKSV